MKRIAFITSPNERRNSEGGFTSVEWMVAVAFSLLVMVMLVNFIAIQYGRGVLRAAADEGARAGNRVNLQNPTAPLSACQAREKDLLDGLGSMASDVQFNCRYVNGQNVQAQASATFKGWLAFVPSVAETATASSVSEQQRAPQ
jgi:hypothetical protein